MNPGFWPILAPGHYLNKLGRGSLGDATYQIYQGFRPCGFREEVFSCFTIQAYVKHVTPGAGPFSAPGA